MPPHRKLIALRLGDQLLARLKRSAKEDERTYSYQIRKAIEFWLQARDAHKGSPKASGATTRKRPSKS